MAKTKKEILDELTKTRADIDTLGGKVSGLRKTIVQKKDEHEINKVLEKIKQIR
jgi:hypothetical protein